LTDDSTDKPEIDLKNVYLHHNAIISKDWLNPGRDNWAYAWIDVDTDSMVRSFEHTEAIEVSMTPTGIPVPRDQRCAGCTVTRFSLSLSASTPRVLQEAAVI
jgi:hypothetical protein